LTFSVTSLLITILLLISSCLLNAIVALASINNVDDIIPFLSYNRSYKIN
jgi:hypothetical protein